MKIFDIFSKLKEKDLPVAKIEEIVIANLVQGINDSEFDVKLDEPADLSENDRTSGYPFSSRDLKKSNPVFSSSGCFHLFECRASQKGMKPNSFHARPKS